MAIKPLMNDIVDFQYVRNGIVGDEQRGCLVIGPELTYQAARSFSPEIAVKHAALFPFFQDKVNRVNDPSVYKYFMMQLPNGNIEVVGYPWVNDETFKTILGRNRIYSISNFSEKMAGPLAKLLKDLGCTYTFNDVDR